MSSTTQPSTTTDILPTNEVNLQQSERVSTRNRLFAATFTLISLFVLLPSLALAHFSPSQENSLARNRTAASPLDCGEAAIAKWEFRQLDDLASTVGSGVITVGVGLAETTFTVGNSGAGGSGDYALRHRGWTSGTLKSDSTDYLEFKVDSSVFTNIKFNFAEQRSGNNGPRGFALFYSTDGVNYTQQVTETLPDNPAWRPHEYDLSSVTGLNNKANLSFRLYGYDVEVDDGRWSVDDVEILGSTCEVLTPTPISLKGTNYLPVIFGDQN